MKARSKPRQRWKTSFLLLGAPGTLLSSFSRAVRFCCSFCRSCSSMRGLTLLHFVTYERHCRRQHSSMTPSNSIILPVHTGGQYGVGSFCQYIASFDAVDTWQIALRDAVFHHSKLFWDSCCCVGCTSSSSYSTSVFESPAIASALTSVASDTSSLTVSSPEGAIAPGGGSQCPPSVFVTSTSPAPLQATRPS